MGAQDLPITPTRHRITVVDYHRLAEVGILGPEARTELIDGEMIDMAPIGTKHGSAVLRLNTRASEAVGRRALVSVQSSLSLGEASEPQPDLMLLKPRDDFYADAHPRSGDVLLLIEVSDSTARYDLGVKLPLYARHGIREVWIVDLEARLLRMFHRPHGDEYLDASATATPGTQPVEAIAGIAIDLDGVL